MDGWPGQIVSLWFCTPCGRSLFLCRSAVKYRQSALTRGHNQVCAAVISSTR